jgi:1-phosphofructokinase family hexose kinase
MKAIIISLNCVIDTHIYIKNFKCNEENRIINKTAFAAGKGTNIAKVLDVLSVPYELFLLLGKENEKLYNSLLSEYNIQSNQFFCNGKTRENISIHSENISETRFCEDGFFANDEICNKLIEEAFDKTSNGDIVVLSGRLPKGISKNKLITKLEKFKEKKVKFIIDSASFTIDDYKLLSPFLIKPNEDEIKLYGSEISQSVDNLLKNGVENVAFSKGKKGITLFNDKHVITAIPPEIKVLSTVGAGDSSVAGFIFGIIKGESLFDCLKTAVSCGSATCMTDGGLLPTLFDIEKIKERIIIQ